MHARHLCVALSLAAAVVGSRPLAAQQSPRIPLRLGIGVGSMAIERATADQMRVHNRAIGGQIDVGVVAKRFFVLSADFGYLSLSDHATFTQNTTAGEMKSTAGVAHFSVLAGPQTRPLQLASWIPAVTLGVTGGTTFTSASRSIDNCTDCRVDDLDIPAGAFVQPALTFGRGNGRLRVSGRQYLSGDGFRNLISAGFEVGR